MNNLVEVEQSVSNLSEQDFEQFREWFFNYDYQKWDIKLASDIKKGKLNTMGFEAIQSFKKGNFKSI